MNGLELGGLCNLSSGNEYDCSRVCRGLELSESISSGNCYNHSLTANEAWDRTGLDFTSKFAA